MLIRVEHGKSFITSGPGHMKSVVQMFLAEESGIVLVYNSFKSVVFC